MHRRVEVEVEVEVGLEEREREELCASRQNTNQSRAIQLRGNCCNLNVVDAACSSQSNDVDVECCSCSLQKKHPTSQTSSESDLFAHSSAVRPFLSKYYPLFFRVQT